MKVSVVVAAAGEGRRLRSLSAHKLPKVLLPLGGKTLLERSVKTFEHLPQVKEVVVTAPRALRARFLKQLKLLRCRLPIRVVSGGRTRTESVANGLSQCRRDTDWVMVHDAARPFLHQDDIKNLFRIARRGNCDGVVLGRKVIPTLKNVFHQDQSVLFTVNRNGLWEAETPQLIRKQSFLKAYELWQKQKSAVTDDTSLVERLGGDIRMVEARHLNPKITTPSDWRWADGYLKGMRMQKIGKGHDLHRLIEGRKMTLGGVRIPFHKGPLGHSDGDAVLHAVIDALLGAAGLGDIGDWFSDTRRSLKGIDSSTLLKRAAAQIQEKEFCVVNLDVTVSLERPRLGSAKNKMRKKIAQLLNLNPHQVNIKAKTAEGLGRVGRGEAVSCEAICLLERQM